MNREIIFNFLSQNVDTIRDVDVVEMTICLFGEIFENRFTKNVLKEEQLYLYHVKLPRMYFKNKSMNISDNSILTLSADVNEIAKFSYNDFTFTLTDPFYEKDIREFNFRYLYLVPIISKKEKVGMIIVYANDDDCEFKFDNNSLSKLAVNLTKNEEASFLEEIKNNLNDFDPSNINYFINDKINKKLINCKSLQSSFNYDEVIYYEKKLTDTVEYKELSIKYTLLKKNMSVDYPDLELYYFKDLDDFDLIRYYKTFKHRKNSKEFMVFINGLNAVKKFVRYFSDKGKLELYGYSDDNYFIIISNSSLLKDVSSYLDKELKANYSIIIKDLDFITDKINLDRFLKYLAVNEPRKFDIKDYKQFILNIGEDLYKASKDKLASNSLLYEGNTYLVINKPFEKMEYTESMKQAMNRIVACINKNLDNDYFLISLLPEMLDTRKIKELFKKLNNLEKHVIIVLSDYTGNKNLVFNAYNTIKLNNYSLFVNSTIIQNFNLFSNMSLIDGVYIDKGEFEAIQNGARSLAKAILVYLFKEQKQIIFEKTDDEEKNNQFINDNIYFISKL